MVDIIKHQIGEESVNSVSARELHSKLEVKKDFSDWIKAQIKRGMFEENIDFITIWHDPQKEVVKSSAEILQIFRNTQQAVRNGYQTDYILTLDTAKHIALMSGTVRGKEVRNYFIEVEKKYWQQNLEPKPKNLISVSDQELDRELKALDFILGRMNFSEKDKIDFVNETLERINFPQIKNPYLRKLEPVFTVTELLKEFSIDIRPADFNKKLESFGVIQRSSSGNWELIDMRFGENRKFGNSIGPRYYRSEFQKLLEIILSDRL
jgi:phage anti-repressor protein